VMTRASKEDRVTGLLRLRWGTLDNQQGTQAIASRVGMLLTEGQLAWGNDDNKREALSQTQINERMLALDASIRISTSQGGLTASLEFPAKHTAAVLDLLSGLLRHPAMPSAIFERQMRASISTLPAARDNPNALTTNLIGRNHRAHYPPSDPRAVMSQDAWDAALRSVTHAQVKDYWQRFGNAQHGEFVFAGPIDLEPIQQQLQNLWGDWASREPYARWRAAHAAPAGEAFAQLPVREKSNAVYEARIAFPLHQRHEDFTALITGVELFSRLGLWQRIREKEGISYGVGASLGAPWDGDAAAIFINASFAPHNLAALRKAVREVIEATRQQGYSAEQVGQALTTIQTRRKERLHSPANAIDTIAFNLSEGRALDANKEFDARYQVVTATQVNAALRKYLDLNQLREVVAGSFEAPQ
jgi:zinc protease